MNKWTDSIKKLSLGLLALSSTGQSATLSEGQNAPIFKAQLHDGTEFDLNSRKGHWTVLYFYPKAETPGCTKQACAFRDSIKTIRDEGAEVYGVSTDKVAAQAAFHKHHHLNFSLIADPQSKVVDLYGTKMPLIGISKRWTFIIDPQLKVRSIDTNVDPVKDPQKVSDKIKELKKTST